MINTIKNIQPKTIIKVVTYLNNELGLQVYGQNANLNTKQGEYGLMDYSPEDCVKLRAIYIRGDKLLPPKDD